MTDLLLSKEAFLNVFNLLDSAATIPNTIVNIVSGNLYKANVKAIMFYSNQKNIYKITLKFNKKLEAIDELMPSLGAYLRQVYMIKDDTTRVCFMADFLNRINSGNMAELLNYYSKQIEQKNKNYLNNQFLI